MIELKELFERIKKEQKTVIVAGLGRSGTDAALLLKKSGFRVVAIDQKVESSTLETASFLDSQGVDTCLGFSVEEKIKNASLVVLSPGIPPTSTIVQNARLANIPLYSEFDIAWSLLKSRPALTIAVTGTNGKTTVSSLIHSILEYNGKKSVLVGNIGTPLSSMVDSIDEKTYVVAEVSSFQLHYSRVFSPDVGVILNISPDHFDWHSSMEEYINAKKHLIDLVPDDGWLVLNAEDDYIKNFSARNGQKTVWFSSRKKNFSENCAYIEDGIAVVKIEGKRVLGVDRKLFKGIGDHNTENLLAALASAWFAGIDEVPTRQAITDYVIKPHRLQKVISIANDTIVFIDDSKATNTDAAIRAVKSFDHRVVGLFGGRGKESDYSVLGDAIKSSGCIPVVFGESRDILRRDFEKVGLKVYSAKNLKEATEMAMKIAFLISSGSSVLDISKNLKEIYFKTKENLKQRVTVLLSPACASFDEFSGYAERGDKFQQYVKGFLKDAGYE
ncbi:MAG: UDP-N-acetylmuramoyl-L-alanine--D-glutamate ligase [Actinobacteria bacterium]|nr:UDP-N-acetylmuramoyl-L-alanine--D-glutamate ligase [Actinomycetota bacterium]